MTEPQPLLAARGVARRFGARTALEPVDVEVLAGETLALVGPNGAGKSTLLSLLAGALEPSAGHVVTAEGIRVGWVPQRAAHYARLSALENLELFARLEGVGDPQRTARDVAAEFGLPLDATPSGDLSVGNRQRLNLALALLARPHVLLLDEPTASLDPAQRRRLWEIVARVREGGGGVCFATQNLEELARYAARVAVLRAGRLVFAGAVEEYEHEHLEDVFA